MCLSKYKLIILFIEITEIVYFSEVVIWQAEAYNGPKGFAEAKALGDWQLL
jgi:hypothetical protein